MAIKKVIEIDVEQVKAMGGLEALQQSLAETETKLPRMPWSVNISPLNTSKSPASTISPPTTRSAYGALITCVITTYPGFHVMPPAP